MKQPSEKQRQLVTHIESAIIESIEKEENFKSLPVSEFLHKELGYNYTHMSNLFKKVRGSNIREFVIGTKIARVKLLLNQGVQLTDIAYRLNYSSLPHLSNQFKTTTGIWPYQYKLQSKNDIRRIKRNRLV